MADISEIERNTFYAITDAAAGAVPRATEKQINLAFDMADDTLCALRKLEPAIPERRGLFRIEIAVIWHAQLAGIRDGMAGGRRRRRREDSPPTGARVTLTVVQEGECDG